MKLALGMPNVMINREKKISNSNAGSMKLSLKISDQTSLEQLLSSENVSYLCRFVSITDYKYAIIRVHEFGLDRITGIFSGQQQGDQSISER